MKQFLSIALGCVCAGLVIALITMKRGADAQHVTDSGAITDYSNRLDLAQTEIAIRNGKLLTLSNQFEECQSAVVVYSNNLTEAQSTILIKTEQITNLNQQIAAAQSDNQHLGQRVLDLTNQVAGLTSQISLTQSNLNQANKDYALLENRFRIDVAERVVVERKFNNSSELLAQLQYLKTNPAVMISADDIYASLDVEVKTNRVHVITPN